MFVFDYWILPVVAFLILVVSTLIFLASRYKRCPSDKILVIYGKVGAGQSANCIHGGGALVWPLIQDYAYMSLTPMTIPIPLQKALSLQNIRINVPSTFTVGVSTEEAIMSAAAERLLNQTQNQIEEMAREIIFGQLRLTVASLTIEQINQDRESFLESIRKNVAPELNKIGLYLINVNITDITDESGYIDSIGKKAASEAINQAKVDVAEQDKKGAIGEAEATREKTIRVAENVAESEKGKKRAEADQRVFVQQQETTATIGEAEANREKTIRVAENVAESEKGKKKAEADQRIFVQGQEAQAIEGENKAKADIAAYNAQLAVKQAEALQRGEVAKREAEVEIQKAQAKAEAERLNAAEVVRQEIDKTQGRDRRRGRGREDPPRGQGAGRRHPAQVPGRGRGDSQGPRQQGGRLPGAGQGLQRRRQGGRDPADDREDRGDRPAPGRGDQEHQDRQGHGLGRRRQGRPTSTANFLSGLVKSLPPLHEVAGMAGIELPKYLGEVAAAPAAGEIRSGSQL